MNPTDEEEQKSEVTPTSEEIEELLEPKAIPEERITRHAERNDSYRESPTIGSDEEIIQPPLEPEVSEPVQPAEVYQPTESEIIPQEQSEEVVEHTDISTVGEHRITQDEILASAPRAEEQVIESNQQAEVTTSSFAEQKAVPLSDPMAVHVEPLVTQTVPEPPQQTPPQSPEGAPVMYHTVSGGPETIHDKIAAQHKIDEVNAPPINTVHPLVTSASGYTIPNPNYIPPLQPEHVTQSNFGMIFFLIVQLIK
jgi:hypothetical protein